jgi:hypothetical protein
MGRPPKRKKGAYTAAERQRNRRKRLAKAKREAEVTAKREASHAYYMARPHKPAALVTITREPPLPDRADEIALQIAEALHLDPDLSIDDIRAAIDRRWNMGPITQWTEGSDRDV